MLEKKHVDRVGRPSKVFTGKFVVGESINRDSNKWRKTNVGIVACQFCSYSVSGDDNAFVQKIGAEV